MKVTLEKAGFKEVARGEDIAHIQIDLGDSKVVIELQNDGSLLVNSTKKVVIRPHFGNVFAFGVDK